MTCHTGCSRHPYPLALWLGLFSTKGLRLKLRRRLPIPRPRPANQRRKLSPYQKSKHSPRNAVSKSNCSQHHHSQPRDVPFLPCVQSRNYGPIVPVTIEDCRIYSCCAHAPSQAHIAHSDAAEGLTRGSALIRPSRTTLASELKRPSTTAHPQTSDQ